jgi:DNA-binding SARP family transcriptional activator
MSVRLRLFGRPHVDSAGGSQLIPMERRCQLLLALALRGSSMSRDEAAGLFWSDRSNQDARRNLRKVLHDAAQLPWAIGACLTGETIRWSPPTDVQQFEHALARGDLAGAIDLSTPPLLDGFDSDTGTFSDWLRNERRRLAERRRSAVLRAFDGRTLTCDARISLARHLLALDPLDEDVLAALLEALREAGATVEAKRAYADYAERLAEEMAAEPTGRLRALVRRTDAPLEASTFVGRADDLAALLALLTAPHTRLLTLLGPGGVGKSRLAKAVLRPLEVQFEDGIYWIPLDDLDASAAVAPRIAHLANIELSSSGDAQVQVCAWFSPRDALLVLDNAEHIEGIESLVQTLLDSAPRLKLLMTSRRRLALPMEQTQTLRGLQLPSDDTAASVQLSEAGELFIRRARQAKPTFRAAPEITNIARLVRAVDGLPLAIELAAAWARVLPVGEMLIEIERSIALLERLDEPEERADHRSLAATLEQSWRLLTPVERRALAAVSVFAGPFSRTAALSVCGASMAMLSTLLDRSLLETLTTDTSARLGEQARFRLHPLVKQFATAKAKEANQDGTELAQAHAAFFAELLSELQQPLRSGDFGSALLAMEQCLPDCRKAWAYATERVDTRFIELAAPSLMLYYEARGLRREGIDLFWAADGFLSRAAPHAAAARAALASCLASLLYRNGDMALTIDVATRGVHLARDSSTATALKGCLMYLGLAHWQRAEWTPARKFVEEALVLAKADADLRGVAAFSTSLAMIEQETGNIAAAEAGYREALRINRQLRDSRALATTLNNLASLLLDAERTAEALPVLDEGMRTCVEHGIEVMRANFLLGLGRARFELGQLAAADDLTRQARSAADKNGEPHIAAEAAIQLARITLAAGDSAVASRVGREALARALRLDNPPVLLDAIACIAQCRAAAGDLRGAAELSLFVAAHPAALELIRQRAATLVDSLSLDAAGRDRAEQQARRYELTVLAAELARAGSS